MNTHNSNPIKNKSPHFLGFIFVPAGKLNRRDYLRLKCVGKSDTANNYGRNFANGRENT